MANDTKQSAASEERGGFDDQLIRIYRCAVVVKGGRRFSFGALVVAGNRNGEVGFGYAKAKEVPGAVEKAGKQAKRNTIRVSLDGSTIPHEVTGQFGASKVKLVPATPGTGVKAGTSVRAVLELAGVRDVLTKSYGSTSPKNLVKATMDALQRIRTREDIQRLRGVALAAEGHGE